MRRAIVLLSSVACTAGVSGLALAGPGSASKSPTPHRITVAVSPNPVLANHPVTVKGRLVGGGAGIAVVLWRELSNQRRFHVWQRTTTNGRGEFTFMLGGGMTSNRSLYVAGAGLRSRTVFEKVRANVTLQASDAIPAPGEAVTLSGNVSPSYVGHQVQLEQNTPNGWKVVTKPWLFTRAGYSKSETYNTDGSVQLRAFLPKNQRNINSYSPVVTLSVADVHKIKHVVVIMQENRSFDQYFGSYPGADGIPGVAGNPGTVPCVPDPAHSGQCVMPFHNTTDQNYGGPHGQSSAIADMNCADFASRTGCQMDGFVGQAESGSNCGSDPTNPQCSPCSGASAGACNDVMGYHDGSDIPNYWTYAHDFVLQDHMFEPNASWSLPSHLYMVSGWSAFCTDPLNPASCTNALQNPNGDAAKGGENDGALHYAWTDMTYLLHKAGISWGYYVFNGTEPDCEQDQAMTCQPVPQNVKTPGIWNPLPSFTDVAQDQQGGNIQSLTNFYTAAKSGTLPAVSWIDPTGKVSEHPTALVSAGQTYVTGLINAIMQGPDWNSTAIFLSWDDWGGFYDHVVPPSVDANGYGLRVPGMLISPYAKQGMIDSQVLSHDAYNKFIEADFLGGQQLNPATDGRPDPRISVREASSQLGDLTSEFNFSQSPRAPVILPVCPTTDLTPTPTC